jgi:endonuclease/exonuclease/phosphatase family metal-dependent hydrolase
MTEFITVASYNVHSCVGLDGVLAPDRILKVLAEIDADVIALQELGSRRPGAEPQFRLLARELGMEGAYDSELMPIPVPFGNAIFVRGRIVEARVVDLSVGRFEPRKAVDVRAAIGNRALRCLTTHLGLRPFERRRQVALLEAALADARHAAPATLVLGDFNVIGPERRVLCRLGAPRREPRMPTWPSDRPLMSIDKIWTRPTSLLQDVRVHRSALARVASDHLPIVGRLKLDLA